MIHSGDIETKMATEVERVPTYYDSVPLGRIGQSIEIAEVVAFLASDDSFYCTGTQIIVDGVMRLWTTDQ